MRRGLSTFIAFAALLPAFAPAAFAQDPVDPFDDPSTPEPAATATPGAPAPDPPEPDTPEAEAEDCDRVEGTDYCLDPCRFQGDDADYAYGTDCLYDAAGGGEPPPPRRKRRAAAAVQPLPAGQLPMTGGEPWLIAACGAGFLMAGSGLRLRARAR